MSFVQKHYLYFILSFFAVSRKWVILRPLMLCIFPAVFIILLGPIIGQAMKGM